MHSQVGGEGQALYFIVVLIVSMGQEGNFYRRKRV